MDGGRPLRHSAVSDLRDRSGMTPTPPPPDCRHARRPKRRDRLWLQVFRRSGSRFLVKKVVPNGPADRAGLRRGDALLAIDGVALHGRAPARPGRCALTCADS
jgi:predicted metalloprotease with PDZ domain